MSQTLTVTDMGCSGCESTVEAAISSLDGCTSVTADHEAGTVTVAGDVDESALRGTIEESGYTIGQ